MKVALSYDRTESWEPEVVYRWRGLRLQNQRASTGSGAQKVMALTAILRKKKGLF